MAVLNRLICGVLFLIVLVSCGTAIKQTKPYSPEIKLDVPFEPNLGNTCFSSSFAMVMRYWGKDVHVNDVLKIVGLPPFKTGYEHPELNAWMKKNHGLEFLYLPGSRIEDLKLYLNEGYPVIVHQTFTLKDNTGHNRVVKGYSDQRNVFIVNDPSPLGRNYEIPYADFEKLWSRIATHEPGPQNKIYLVIPLRK
jgi:ABC-type bacteriocin/lantibiotic exporter with double-glycine peptidase domain